MEAWRQPRARCQFIAPITLRKGLPIKYARLAGLSPTFHTVLSLLTGIKEESWLWFYCGTLKT